MRIKEKFNQKLLVEGNDDQHVLWALCAQHKISERFDIIDCEGIDNLLMQLPLRLKQSGVETIGIIIDADSDVLKSYDRILAFFEKLQISLPENLPNDGLIILRSGIKIGVWLMPDNNTKGMLEDFIAFLIPKEDALLPAAQSILNEFENSNQNLYSINHRAKALIHTWLSWQEDPGTPMGLAITKRYLTTDEATCLKLIGWINKLFIEK
jgi:hypothetical protein